NALGERFMARYDAERMELSTRDRVALAKYTEIAEGRGGPNGGVFLDITHASKELIVTKLPRMYRQFIEYQMLDISRERMEVAPTSHYSMGGIVVEPESHATEVVGLYAAGECTAGLRGANPGRGGRRRRATERRGLVGPGPAHRPEGRPDGGGGHDSGRPRASGVAGLPQPGRLPRARPCAPGQLLQRPRRRRPARRPGERAGAPRT